MPSTIFDVFPPPVPAAGGGDVVGPASSTDNAVVRFDGTTGKLLQNSLGILDDLGNLAVETVTCDQVTLAGGAANAIIFSTGQQHVLDTDADTTIRAAADDDVRIRAGGVDRVTLTNSLLTVTVDQDVTSTGYHKVSSGTTAQRPGTPVNGMIRYNTTLNALEAYINGAWTTIGAVAGGVSILGWSNNVLTSSGITALLLPAGAFSGRYLAWYGRDNVNTNRAHVELRARTAGTLRNFQIYLSANSLPSPETVTFAIVVNGTASALSITISNGTATGWLLDSDSVSIAVGDLIAIEFSGTAGSVADSIEIETVSVELVA